MAGLSQKQLGILAGLDEFVASTRINRYEVGVHEPDLGTAAHMAAAASVPLAYLFADEDLLAQMILSFSRLPAAKQVALLEKIEETPDMNAPPRRREGDELNGGFRGPP